MIRTVKADFTLMDKHIPYHTTGYGAWMAILALQAAVTSSLWLGLTGCLVIVLALNILQAVNRHFLYQTSHPTPAAFYLSYFGVPEAAIMGVLLVLRFAHAMMFHNVGEERTSVWNLDTISVIVATPLFQQTVTSKTWQSVGIPGFWQRLPRVVLPIVGSLLVVYTISSLSSSSSSPFAQQTAGATTTARFLVAWLPLLSAGLALDWPGHGGFYKWYIASSLQMNKHRGLGFSDYKPYGFISIPHLSDTTFLYTSLGLAAMAQITAMLVATNSAMPSYLVPVILLGILFPGLLVYASQLGQESSLGEHHSIPAIVAMVYLGLGWNTHWATAMLKVHMMSLYFSAGLLKLVTSALSTCGPWWKSATMQHFIFSARFSRPTHGWQDTLRRYIISTPRLCTAMALTGLALELGAPLMLLHASLSTAFAWMALLFHLGIFTVQGISFVSYWCPVLIVFLIDPAPVVSFEALLPAANASRMEYCAWTVAVLHLLAQCVLALIFHEAWSLPSPLPFSCMPVFAIPCNVFDSVIPVSWAMIGGSVHCTGHVGPLEWLGPQFQDPWYHLSQDDVKALPFPVVWICVGEPLAVDADELSRKAREEQAAKAKSPVMQYLHTNPFYDQWERQFFNLYHAKILESGFAIFSNFDLPPKLASELEGFCRFRLRHSANDCTNPNVIEELLDRQTSCVERFESIVHTNERPVEAWS